MACAPALAVAAAIALCLLASGVAVVDAAKFAGYELAFAAIPGSLLYAALRPGLRSPLRVVLTGWAIGYAIEILAFVVAAQLNIRAAFSAYPLVACAVFGALWWRRSRPAPIAQPHHAHWVLGALCALGVAYVWLSFISVHPAPGSVPSVTYFSDPPLFIGNVAEVKHFWDHMDPRVAGERYFYQWFLHYHQAGMSQVTGVETWQTVLRFFPVMMAALVTAQYYLAGSALSGQRSIGLAAAAIGMLIGEPDPVINGPNFLFTMDNFHVNYVSPTQGFGLIFLLAAMVEVRDVLGSARPGRGAWVAAALLLFGAAGAKSILGPVIVGGLAVVTAWCAVFDRRALPRALGLAGLAAAFVAAMYAVYYRESGGALSLQPLQNLLDGNLTNQWQAPAPAAPRLERWVFSASVMATNLVGLLGANAVGLPWLAARVRLRPRLEHAWLGGLFLAGMGGYVALASQNLIHDYLAGYALAAAAPLSAMGLAGLWSDLRAGTSGLRRWSARVAGFAAAALLLLGAVDVPFDGLGRVVAAASGGTIYYTQGNSFTPDTHEAMRWLRDHTPASAVFAVNNQTREASGPRYFYYTAFSERRCFLEGWMWTNKAAAAGLTNVERGRVNPFADRLALNQRVFEQADRAALRELTERFGVAYLVVDKMRGKASPQVASLGARAFSNAEIDIYRVAP